MPEKVLIGHAVADENGGSDGQPGDQTGKEIRIQEWYKRSGGWNYYLECTDPEMAKKAVEYMTDICKSPLFGYSKKTRWTGYNSIVNNNNEIEGAEKGNFDCSSLCISCYILAGLKHPKSGYTQSMRKSLLATGKFVATKDKARVDSSDYAKAGSLYLSEGHHVCMVLNDGPKVGKDDPKPDPDPISDKTRVEILGNVNIRKQPTEFGKVIQIARKGESYEYLASSTDARGVDWYAIKLSDTEFGFVSSFSNKSKKYTRLVIPK